MSARSRMMLCNKRSSVKTYNSTNKLSFLQSLSLIFRQRSAKRTRKIAFSLIKGTLTKFRNWATLTGIQAILFPITHNQLGKMWTMWTIWTMLGLTKTWRILILGILPAQNILTTLWKPVSRELNLFAELLYFKSQTLLLILISTDVRSASKRLPLLIPC